MLSRYGKRRLQILFGFSVWMLAWHYVDLYWQVMPALNNHAKEGVAGPSSIRLWIPLDIVVWLGMGLLFMGAVASAMRGVNLVPIKDPSLGDALRFENQ